MGDLNRIGGQHYEIMRRCYDENCKTYKSYGAKGIKVCEEWHDRETFKEWAYAHGYVNGMRVLRRDTNGDYCPDNCYIGESDYITKRKGYKKFCKERAKVNKKRKEELGIESLKDSPLSEVYYGMKKRCYNPNDLRYHSYGGRGIKICDEWLGSQGIYNFISWAMTEGGYEKGLSIERIDVNGDYCPNNCTFISMYEQAQNKRRNHIFFVNGERMSAMAYCRYKNINYERFMYRLNKGENISKILDALEK